jgi:hypothetical protein
LADYFEETSRFEEIASTLDRWGKSDYWMASQMWKYRHNFKMDFVVWFPKAEWKISSLALSAWLREQREQGDPAPEHTLLDIKDGWTGWSKRWDGYNNYQPV